MEKQMSTYIDYSIKTREELKDYILDECGGDLQTVEITDKQLDGAINASLEIFTKFATFDTKYLSLQLSDYDSLSGFDVSPYRVASIESIEDDGLMGFGDQSGQIWSMSNAMNNQGVSPYGGGSNGSGQNQGLAWVTVQMVHEYSEMTKKMRAAYWDFEFDRLNQQLRLIPDPNYMGTDMDQFLCVAVETIPPDEQLYGEQMVKDMALAKSMIIVGRVRKKFESVQLLGGGNVDSTILEDGKELLEKTMENLRDQEGPSFGVIVG
jgi:hypothetical protein